MSERLLLTFFEAAELLGVSAKSVRRRVDAGLLPSFRDGRIIRVRRVDLEAYIAARTVCLDGDEGTQRDTEGQKRDGVSGSLTQPDLRGMVEA